MTLKECYAALGGSYEDVLDRLLKFLDDSSYDLLCRSMEAQDWPEAFRAAHTIKGLCQNLSFTRLSDSSSQLTEALRNGCGPEAPALAERVAADYQQTASAIRSFREGLPG